MLLVVDVVDVDGLIVCCAVLFVCVCVCVCICLFDCLSSEY